MKGNFPRAAFISVHILPVNLAGQQVILDQHPFSFNFKLTKLVETQNPLQNGRSILLVKIIRKLRLIENNDAVRVFCGLVQQFFFPVVKRHQPSHFIFLQPVLPTAIFCEVFYFSFEGLKLRVAVWENDLLYKPWFSSTGHQSIQIYLVFIRDSWNVHFLCQLE